jgi:hypothetical protein
MIEKLKSLRSCVIIIIGLIIGCFAINSIMNGDIIQYIIIWIGLLSLQLLKNK